MEEKIIGIVSDTHGLLRTEALTALQGSDYIIHAGDVGGEDVIRSLNKVAPVYAVRGNTDSGELRLKLQSTEMINFDETSVYVLHDLYEMDIDPEPAKVSVIISGHTHQPMIQKRKGVLYVNPGSIGPRRYDFPISLAKLRISEQKVEAEIIELDI